MLRTACALLLAAAGAGCVSREVEPVTVGLAFDAQGFPMCEVSTGDTVGLTEAEKVAYAKAIRESNGWVE